MDVKPIIIIIVIIIIIIMIVIYNRCCSGCAICTFDYKYCTRYLIDISCISIYFEWMHVYINLQHNVNW